jgi:hypothetical protein
VKSRDTDNIGEQVKNKQKDEKNGLLQTLERSETMCSRRVSSSSSENIVGERGKKKSNDDDDHSMFLVMTSTDLG